LKETSNATVGPISGQVFLVQAKVIYNVSIHWARIRLQTKGTPPAWVNTPNLPVICYAWYS